MITLTVGDDWQAAVNAAEPGETFHIAAGTHRHQSVTPKNDQHFIGEPGAIMSGGRVLTNPKGRNPWVYADQTQHGDVLAGSAEYCEVGFACGQPDDVFLDGTLLLPVTAASAGGPGKVFFDYGAQTIAIWDDPTGHTVTASVTPQAFTHGWTTGVTIEHLIIEHYAAPTEVYTVDMGEGWTLRDCEVRYNHFSGIRVNSGTLVTGCRVHHNGAFGMNGSGAGPIVENTDISDNNTAHYNCGWGAGGTKFTFTDGLIFRRNTCYRNRGPGVWTDINNIHTLYEYNTCVENGTEGIFHEVSYDAIIRHNVCARNGLARLFPGYVAGAGILVSSSPNVEVYGNTLDNNWQGIAGLDTGRVEGLDNHGPWRLTNLRVYGNAISQPKSHGPDGSYGVTGVCSLNSAGLGTFTPENGIKFTGNAYTFAADTKHFNWNDGTYTIDDWHGFGHDVP